MIEGRVSKCDICPPGALPHGTHQPDGNGGCAICRIEIEHSDGEMLVMRWPCPSSVLFQQADATP